MNGRYSLESGIIHFILESGNLGKSAKMYGKKFISYADYLGRRPCIFFNFPVGKSVSDGKYAILLKISVYGARNNCKKVGFFHLFYPQETQRCNKLFPPLYLIGRVARWRPIFCTFFRSLLCNAKKCGEPARNETLLKI